MTTPSTGKKKEGRVRWARMFFAGPWIAWGVVTITSHKLVIFGSGDSGLGDSEGAVIAEGSNAVVWGVFLIAVGAICGLILPTLLKKE